ncbi:MAG TPA: hypothetical protein VI757_15920 [Bacteroidia bacterium]|nr:hypothetical protein [Bacteroidia bacterium]
MKKILAALILAVFALAACTDSTESQITEPAATENTGMQAAAPLVTDTPPPSPPPSNSGTLNAPPSLNAAPVVPPAQTNTTAAGANPPHGQPGHRCDIAVGAPLNSPPAAPPSPAPAPTAPTSGMPTPSFSPTPMVPVTAPPPAPSAPPAPVVTAPGMNPPHGQPGHDCAIAVGAPLKKQTDSTGNK